MQAVCNCLFSVNPTSKATTCGQECLYVRLTSQDKETILVQRYRPWPLRPGQPITYKKKYHQAMRYMRHGPHLCIPIRRQHLVLD